MRLFRMKGKSEAGEEEKELVLDTEAEAESDAPAGPLVTEVKPTPEVKTAEPAVDAPEGAPAPRGDLLARIGAEADAEIAAEEAAATEETDATEGKPPSEDDELDPELLDIFRDARNEVEESTLASELEDISAQELLNDAVGVGHRLGISVEGPVGKTDGEVGEPSGDDEGQVKPDEHQEP